MMRTVHRWACWLMVVGMMACPAVAGAYRLAEVTVVVDAGAPEMVKLAGEEVRAYVYRLTSAWPTLAAQPPGGKPAIILRSGPGNRLPTGGADPAQNFALYAEQDGQVVHGASDRATLWAAYHLIESWGVGFYLGGDAVPGPDAERKVEVIEHAATPALAIRGNLPWFNFLNSPTTWNPQDYKTFFAQLAKQKANFIGFHAYDHEPFGAYDITDTKATMGGPLMTTSSEHRWWSPHVLATSDHVFGTDLFFDRGEWGCEVGIEEAWTFAPGRATRWQKQMMAEALAYAQRLGVHTCLGWEVTGNPDEPQVREAFRRRLQDTLASYPLDYFWVWQSEGRGTGRRADGQQSGVALDADIREAFAYLGKDHDLSEPARITKFIRLAHATLAELAPKVRLIVSGWGGDQHMHFSTLYIGLDKVVPGDVIFSALDNIDPRLSDSVSKAYGQVGPNRQRWPIPWFESDGAHTRIDQTGPQTNVTAFEPLLKDTVSKGCQGALGIHWRTRNVEDVAGYLYRFGWNPRLTAAEFFAGYARDHYGPADAERMARVHLRLEEFGPQYVGARGTTECGSRHFIWFTTQGKTPQPWEPNRASDLPDTSRFGELEALRDDLLKRSREAADAGRAHAAVQYHDLARTIHWLVTRARVGLAIWGQAAPLEKRLREAEQLLEQRQVEPARKAASAILAELETYDFRSAFQALASTCRTRGELGMLATANARYGRYYTTFIERIARLMDRPMPQHRVTEPWKGPEVLTVFPVPNDVSVADGVSFDAVLLPVSPGVKFQIELVDLTAKDHGRSALPLERLGGAYHRALFYPGRAGAWAWKLSPVGTYPRPPGAIPLDGGVVRVGP